MHEPGDGRLFYSLHLHALARPVCNACQFEHNKVSRQSNRCYTLLAHLRTFLTMHVGTVIVITPGTAAKQGTTR